MTYLNPKTQSHSSRGISESKKVLPPASFNPPPPAKRAFKKPSALGFKEKTLGIATALSVIPVVLTSLIAYKITERNIVSQINQTQFERTHHLADLLSEYIKNRVSEAQILADSPIFTNPNVMEMVTISQKKEALDDFRSETKYYDSIVYLDLQGNPVFQSRSELPLRKNYSDRVYFQQAISRRKTVMNSVGISSNTGELRMEFAVPVIDSWTGETIGILRFRIPKEQLEPLLADYASKSEQWHLINTENIFSLSSVENFVNQPLNKYYPQIEAAHLEKQIVSAVVKNPYNANQEQLINYAPVRIGEINPELNLGTAIALNTDIAFAPLKSLRLIFIGGTIGTAILVGTIASFLANRILQALSKLTSGVDSLSQGKLDTRIYLERQDEIGVLGNQIDQMAEHIESSMVRQKTIAKTSELMARISQAKSTRELQLPLNLFLKQVRRFIKADRVVFYQFDAQCSGTIVAESVDNNFPRTLGVQFEDNCFAEEYVGKYQRGRIRAITDIYRADLTQCHLQQLEPYAIKASLVLPVILEQESDRQSEKLIGLLIAHQCSNTRIWEQSDIDYLQQVAYQLALVLRGYINYKQEDAQTAGVKQDIADVLNAMQEIATGDLSVNLSSQAGSTSELAHSFDSVVNNMRQTIANIKIPAQRINRELTVSKKDAADLQKQLRQQANELVLIFNFMEQIATSITETSTQINLTSNTVNLIVKDIEAEKVNFSGAISFMSQLQNTLKDNNDKVKDLSNASQKMTRVISAIRKINLRASLLASKLSKRIPEVDNSKFGLKEEIESIQQSIAATKELETVIRGIDLEISRVLRNYEISKQQLKQENYLVDNANNNLEQIVITTKSVQQNLLSLVNMSKMQVQTTEKITALKNQLNKNTELICTNSERTFDALEQAAFTARDLENVTSFFKLEPTQSN